MGVVISMTIWRMTHFFCEIVHKIRLKNLVKNIYVLYLRINLC